MLNQKGILVTGSHRSGSTWVGKMLSLSSSIGYIHEPFNIERRRFGICRAKFQHWFFYVTEENESTFYQPIKDTLDLNYSFKEDIKEIKSLKDIGCSLRDYIKFSHYQISRVRPLLKDPLAVFSAEWLASRFNMNVIVLIRHPAAFAGSLKIKDWTFPFSHFLEQPLLMRDHLEPFEAEIKDYTKREYPVIDQAILLWKIVHYVIAKYKKNHPDWLLIRHEDISRNSSYFFNTIFNNLNIEFTHKIQNKIEKYTALEKPRKQLLIRRHNLEIKRNSRANIYSWKSRLSASEIKTIRTNVEDISSLFYSDEDWE